MVAGKDVCLECEVTEAGEVVWLKGTELIQPSGRFQVLCRGQQQTLVIRGFSAEDQGEYRCCRTQDPTSPAAATFQGASSGPSEGVRALGCGSEPAPPLRQLWLGVEGQGFLLTSLPHTKEYRGQVGKCIVSSLSFFTRWQLRSH